MNIDNVNYCLGIDAWEGSLELIEKELWDGGVRFIFIRLNDMQGGHHPDANFTRQWEQAAGFYRAPYFVYNPWVDGQTNFDWMAAHMPADARAVAVDIEVRKSGYEPGVYAAEVKKFYELSAKRWKTILYTGGWFLPILSSWPYAEYWYARYPLALYPDNALAVTWDGLKAMLAAVSWSPMMPATLGTCHFWQCSGDRLILPGTLRTMDVDVFQGSQTQLEAWFGPIAKPYEPMPVAWKVFLPAVFKFIQKLGYDGPGPGDE